MRPHVDTRMVLKTFSATSSVLQIWVCSIPTNLRVLPPPMVFGLILALLVTQMLDICLTHIEHVLKRVMPSPLETPLYLGGL